jgi:hypothetical protein
MACQRRSGINHEPDWSSPEHGDTPRTHYRRIGEWIAKRSARIDMGLNAFCRLSRPHHRRTATEDQRYEEASQHCSDYGCARVCRARFGTAYGSGPDCERRRRAGCYSSRWVRPLVSLKNLNEGSAVLPGAAPYPQRLALVRLLEVMALLDEAGCDPTCGGLMLSTPRPQTRSSAP